MTFLPTNVPQDTKGELDLYKYYVQISVVVLEKGKEKAKTDH